MSGFKKGNNIHALHTEIIQGKCPYAEHMNNIQKKSYKELEENLLLEYTKEDMKEAISLFYDSIKGSIEDKGSIDSTINYLNSIVNEHENVIATIDQKFGGNIEITDRIVAGFGTAIRAILGLRDLYIGLGGDSQYTKDSIRKVIYQLTGISVWNFALASQRLKENSESLSIKNRSYDREKFMINDDGKLIVKPGILDNLLKTGRCPAVGIKTEEGNIIIDDMMDRLLG